MVSVVIPVYNQVDLLDRCLASLARQVGVELQVIVVDDRSPEDPEPVLSRHPSVEAVRLEQNVGYAEANNRGLARVRGEYVLFLNSDTELPPDAIARMVAYLEAHPDAGAIHPLHRGTDGVVQRTCYRFPTLPLGRVWDSFLHRRQPNHPLIRDYMLADWDHESPRWVEHAQTSCLLVRKAGLDQTGGMDAHLRLFYNDTDLCRRLHEAGFRTWFMPEVEILHHGGASVQTFEHAEARVYGDRYRYFRKWYGWRGTLAVRWALWSRIGYETLVEVAHGQFRFAATKVQRGLRINRAFEARA